MVIYSGLLGRSANCFSLFLGSRGASSEHVTLKLLKIDRLVTRKRITRSQAVKNSILRIRRNRGLELEIEINLPLIIFYRSFVLIFGKTIAVSILAVGENDLAWR